MFASSCMSLRQCLLQDLAALEAIEANHYAAKQTQSVTLPPAAPHGLAATLACCPADQQHQTHANLQPTHQRKITDAHTAEHPLRVHLQDTETGVQTDKHGPAKPPLNHCMQPAAQRSPWVQQQQHFQHASSRQAPRQTSMQSFMALHANRRQPNVTATAFAAPPSSSAQQPARAACATGMLADDVDDCIDLTSQPEPHDPETAPQAGYICGAAQPYGPCQPAGAGAAVHDQAGKGREKETVEDIIDYHPKNPLMECSSNLLNPGIRVHKYSFSFPLHAKILHKITLCMGLSLLCTLSEHVILRLTAVHCQEHTVRSAVATNAVDMCCVLS